MPPFDHSLIGKIQILRVEGTSHVSQRAVFLTAKQATSCLSSWLQGKRLRRSQVCVNEEENRGLQNECFVFQRLKVNHLDLIKP